MELFESLMLDDLDEDDSFGRDPKVKVTLKCSTCDNSGRPLSFQTPITCWWLCTTAFGSVA